MRHKKRTAGKMQHINAGVENAKEQVRRGLTYIRLRCKSTNVRSLKVTYYVLERVICRFHRCTTFLVLQFPCSHFLAGIFSVPQ